MKTQWREIYTRNSTETPDEAVLETNFLSAIQKVIARFNEMAQIDGLKIRFDIDLQFTEIEEPDEPDESSYTPKN